MLAFPLNLRDYNENRAWMKGCLWLSLDRFERFWPDVGLTLSNGEAVKSAVRNALRIQFAADEEWRTTYYANPDAPEDLNAPDPTKDLPQTCFREINETAGTQDAACIARWLTGAVLGAFKEWSDPHHHWHNTWSSLLYHLGKQAPNMLASSYGIPGSTAQKLVEIGGRYRSEVDRLKERVEAADQEPLSGWDAVAYADYRWETQELSPLDMLSVHLQYVSFDRAWPEILRCTPPAYIDALIKWGRAFHKAHNWPDGVAIPDDVRAAWHQAWRN